MNIYNNKKISNYKSQSFKHVKKTQLSLMRRYKKTLMLSKKILIMECLFNKVVKIYIKFWSSINKYTFLVVFKIYVSNVTPIYVDTHFFLSFLICFFSSSRLFTNNIFFFILYFSLFGISYLFNLLIFGILSPKIFLPIFGFIFLIYNYFEVFLFSCYFYYFDEMTKQELCLFEVLRLLQK